MLKKILKNHLNKNGLSLVEIAVSVALVAVIMISAMSYFNVAWDVRARSDEYNEILNNTIANLEFAKCQKAGDAAGAVVVANNTLTTRGTKVTYTVDKTGIQFISNAIYGSNKIRIVTHSFDNWTKA